MALQCSLHSVVKGAILKQLSSSNVVRFKFFLHGDLSV